MTKEEKANLLNELLEYEENNDIGNLTRIERREFQQWISEALEQEPCETQMIDKSNLSQEQYKADLQSAYDCGRASVKPCEDAISRADAVKVASGYCHPNNIAEELAKLPPVTPKEE